MARARRLLRKIEICPSLKYSLAVLTELRVAWAAGCLITRRVRSRRTAVQERRQPSSLLLLVAFTPLPLFLSTSSTPSLIASTASPCPFAPDANRRCRSPGGRPATSSSQTRLQSFLRQACCTSLPHRTRMLPVSRVSPFLRFSPHTTVQGFRSILS